MCEYLSEVLFSVPLGTHPEEKWLDQMVILFLISSGTTIAFSQLAAPFYVPTAMQKNSDFSDIKAYMEYKENKIQYTHLRAVIQSSKFANHHFNSYKILRED